MFHIFKQKSSQHLSTGARGEKAAENYLRDCGYKILAKNFTNETGKCLGEIDIVAKEGDEVVFVEVKTRKIVLDEKILPEENINPAKLYKLNKIASYYLSKNNLSDANYRFDAISVLADHENNKAILKHLKNIFF